MKISSFISIRNLIWLSIVMSVGIVCVFIWQPVRIFHWQDFRKGKAIATRIEAYRSAHGRLPDTLGEPGMNDDDRIFYRKEENNDYVIWFGTTLGESETYDSRTKEWQ